MPCVSIVIPTYNRAELLKQALRSVLSQTFTDYEAIVVDDGSTDNTREAVESFRDDRFKYVWQENRGLGGARNTGLAHSTGDLVAFLDSDDLLFPNMLELLVPAFDRHPQVGLVFGSHVRVFDDLSFPYPQDFIHSRKDEMVGNMHLDFLDVCRIGVDDLVVRRELFDRFGGFDGSLAHCHDWNMWLRLSKEVDFCAVPGPVSAVRMHPSQMSKDEPGMLECELGLLKAFSPTDRDAGLAKRLARAEIRIYTRRAYLLFDRDTAQAAQWLARAQQISDGIEEPATAATYVVDYASYASTYSDEDKERAAAASQRCAAELHRAGGPLSEADAARYFWRLAASHAYRLGDYRTALKWIGRLRREHGFGVYTKVLIAIAAMSAVRLLATRRAGRVIYPIESILPRIANPPDATGDVSESQGVTQR